MSEIRDLIRSKLTIVDVVGKRVPLTKRGRHYLGLCPFHDDRKPSMNVVLETERYKCFACGAGGDMFQFVMEYHKLDFVEAVRTLADEAGVEFKQKQGGERNGPTRKERLQMMSIAQEFFREWLEKSGEAKAYCQNRGLDAETLESWGIGFAPGAEPASALATFLKKKGYALNDCKELFLVDSDAHGNYFDKYRNRLMFPIHDVQKKIIGFGGRLIGPGNAKYINTSDTPLFSKRNVLYGLHRAADSMSKSGYAVLVEGYLDVIACHRAGVTQAVASLGTALSEEHCKILARYCNEVVILYDADTAGKKAAVRAEEMLSQREMRVRLSLMPEGEDPDTVLRTLGPQAVRDAVTKGIDPMEYRLRDLRAKHSVTEQTYWEEVAKTLGDAATDLEIEKYISRLAAEYPFSRDRRGAIAALKRDIYRVRRRKAGPEKRAVVALQDLELHPYESTLFRAVLEPDTSREALSALEHKEWMLTELGAEIAQALVAASHEGQLDLGKLEDQVLDKLTQVQLRQIMKPTLEDVRGATVILGRRHQQRALQEEILGEDLTDEKLAKLSGMLQVTRNLSQRDT